MEFDQPDSNSNNIASVDLYHIFSPTICTDSNAGRKCVMRVGECLAAFRLLRSNDQAPDTLLSSNTPPAVNPPPYPQKPSQRITAPPLAQHNIPRSGGNTAATAFSGTAPNPVQQDPYDDTDSILEVPDDDVEAPPLRNPINNRLERTEQ